MKTSYFAKSANHPKAIAICIKKPSWFKGKHYPKLAPKYWFLKKYKRDGDTKYYEKTYKEEVLSKLDPEVVFAELGPDSILLCYEIPEKFCHRHLVAKWFKETLNINVKELGE